MTSKQISIPADQITVRRHHSACIAVVGSPNSGKSTLFNRLTGLHQRIGNYPGVTVERHIGKLKVDDVVLQLIDLPGTHGLSAHSMEEKIVVDVLFGRADATGMPDAILAVVDATNLYQGLYLVQQLLELELPVVVALTMSDAADQSGLKVDMERLSRHLGGVPVCPVVATTGQGMEKLRRALAALPDQEAPSPIPVWPALATAAGALADMTAPRLRLAEAQRLLIDGVTEQNSELFKRFDSSVPAELNKLRDELFGIEPPLAVEARVRYGRVREILKDVQQQLPRFYSWRTRITTWINQPIPGTVGLFLVMALVFQAVFAWATPIMDIIDAATAALGSHVGGFLGTGAFASLVSDGIISGVGAVIVFLPQIIILFLFIILLEDSGYLARAAYLLDRVMRSVGLSGQSIIPMISSFACAVPGIMATRVIPNRRDRIATIIAAPFMTCSARLPVYALLIAAFVPARDIGFLNLQGLILFGLYMLGIVAGVLTALLLRKTALRGPKPPFALMLPEFRRPNIRTVAIQLLGRAKVFLRRAGTVIFSVAVVVWALAYYPRSAGIESFIAERQAAVIQVSEEQRAIAFAQIENEGAAAQLEQSWLGRAGHFVEPAFRPLGWDWRVSSAVIAGFPAREVVIAILGTVYAVGGDADQSTLSRRLELATWPDGSPVYTLPMVIGLLIFYAFCLQCAATLAVIRRETNSWRWPVFAWFYMTTIGYTGAMLAYQLGS